jgi:hypothetical protein
MPRPKSDAPAYQFHISGQAVVRLDGKDFYLGSHDSPESRSKYFALLAEYNANGKQAPQQATHQADEPITVRCVTGEYREFTASKPGGDPNEKQRMLGICTTLEDEYGDLPAVDFGPRKLATLRDLLVAGGNSRKYVKRGPDFSLRRQSRVNRRSCTPQAPDTRTATGWTDQGTRNRACSARGH